MVTYAHSMELCLIYPFILELKCGYLYTRVIGSTLSALRHDDELHEEYMKSFTDLKVCRCVSKEFVRYSTFNIFVCVLSGTPHIFTCVLFGTPHPFTWVRLG